MDVRHTRRRAGRGRRGGRGRQLIVATNFYSNLKWFSYVFSVLQLTYNFCDLLSPQMFILLCHYLFSCLFFARQMSSPSWQPLVWVNNDDNDTTSTGQHRFLSVLVGGHMNESIRGGGPLVSELFCDDSHRDDHTCVYVRRVFSPGETESLINQSSCNTYTGQMTLVYTTNDSS